MDSRVDFWFDPSCPLTWVTAGWLREVSRVRPVTPRWRIMSLSILNEDRDDDPEGDTEGYLWMPVRICAAVERHHGHTGLSAYYAALGKRLHEGDDFDPEVFAAALSEAGLPVDLTEAAQSTEYDHTIRQSHMEGIELVGDHVGTPILATTHNERRVAWFGPVLTQVPTGEAAGVLFDAVVTVAGTEGFHEIKGRPAFV